MTLFYSEHCSYEYEGYKVSTWEEVQVIHDYMEENNTTALVRYIKAMDFGAKTWLFPRINENVVCH